MLDWIAVRVSKILERVRGLPLVTDSMVEGVASELRRTFIDADVNYEVADSLVKSVMDKIRDTPLPSGIQPEQFFIFTLYEELKKALGEGEDIILKGKPAGVMISGPNGSGKTTTCAKIAMYLKERAKSVLIVPCDLKRASAVEQLKILAERAGVDFFDPAGYEDPVRVASKGLREARKRNYDVAIFDTAGRLHVDKEMLKELGRIYREIEPCEHLLVLDAMTGQEGIRIAMEFKKAAPFTGLVFTKTDTDAKGGAIISARAATGRAVKFLGTGEGLGDLEKFEPEKIAKKLLGLGDLEELVERISRVIDEEKAKEMEEKARRASFTMEDLLQYISLLKRAGGIRKILPLLPGGVRLKEELDIFLMEDALKRTEAIILSMTKKERNNTEIIDASRRMRIARGSGTTVAEVNRVLRAYRYLKKIMKGGKRKDILTFFGG